MSRAAPKSRASEQDRAIAGLLQFGVVKSVDLGAGRAVVELEPGLSTPAIRWLAPAGDFLKLWAPPSVDEEVALIAPENDLEHAVILGGLFNGRNPAPDSLLSLVLQAAEGLACRFDPAGAVLEFDVAGEIRLKVPRLVVEADVEMTGDFQLTGRLEASDDVVADGKSLKGHRHTGVSTGSGLSGTPQ